ncbi:uncharacterized protein K452DRAFT_258544 [Aplosporella prunicola CBS 121167]|uniref:Signal recognition particle subunit SRP68 n=1 Tax=Aplosporella prunicola CBS 121167 TaxID=1176127 RepID=A0A6A6AYK5_9PEZI|nr:uncharacterized protein K452DRAFT_258544 [Aplosporella prunicola CBS 121167]KAF2136860.1 hypothetical protein K452DRAFT_258544 [Aplosporella prunicola CBS 121167]
MDITSFVVGQRDSALLLGDYNTYRQQLSRRLLTLRKRLGRTTPKNAKYSPKAPITAEDIAGSHDYVHLQILTSERAWAHAMHMKSTHSEENADNGITGSTRKHIISRLHKAATTANELVSLLSDQTVTGATDVDLLEAQAYVYSLSGAEEFEKQAEGIRPGEGQEQRWKSCLVHYSAARIIYNALLQSTKKDLFKEILASTIDPSIRYAAYQSRLPRTLAVSVVARQYFPRDNSALASAVEKQFPDALKDEASATGKGPESTEKVPNTISWRGRSANIVDAAVGQALASVTAAEGRLAEYLASNTDSTSRDKAAAYDDVLIASQDATDSTRHAIEELEKEGVNEGDSRMQDLRVTSLAINYALIGWRVGRNRVLIGSEDGLKLDAAKIKKPRARRDGKEWVEKEEGNGRKLARLRERVVLYDSILQSIDSVKDLRGAMRDAGFIEELDGKRAYFQALKCLNIAYSHALLSNSKNALALFARALDLSSKALSTAAASEPTSSGPPKLDVSPEAAESVHNHLQGLTSQFRGLVELQKSSLAHSTANAKDAMNLTPIVECLNEYPVGGVNLDKLIQWPPRLQPVPVKPLFLDVAWNYIRYPGQEEEEAVTQVSEQNGGEDVEEQPKKRGWFGFGR